MPSVHFIMVSHMHRSLPNLFPCRGSTLARMIIECINAPSRLCQNPHSPPTKRPRSAILLNQKPVVSKRVDFCLFFASSYSWEPCIRNIRYYSVVKSLLRCCTDVARLLGDSFRPRELSCTRAEMSIAGRVSIPEDPTQPLPTIMLLPPISYPELRSRARRDATSEKRTAT